MALSVEKLTRVVEDLLHQYRQEQTRLNIIASYVANQVRDIYVPRKATREYRMLVDQARFNVLPLVITAVAQGLFVDGYRPTGESGRAPSNQNAPIWDAVWQPNRMDARQAALYRAAITYGYSYALVLPGDPAPVITPYSPRKLTAIYDDPVNDEWPTYAMVARRPVHQEAKPGYDPLAEPATPIGTRLTIYDNENRYDVEMTAHGWSFRPLQGETGLMVEEHGLDYCPVVRFLEEQGCDGLPAGKVEPLLPAQRQLNQTTYSLLMAQNYAAFKQRWATGMKIEAGPDGVPVEPFNARVDAVWQNEAAEGKFGEFSESNLSGYLESRDKLLLYISSVAQIPPHQLVVGAGISNISAEALAMLAISHAQDVAEHQTTFGESIEQMLRLAGRALGGEVGTAAWEDTSAQVVWRDTQPRSLAEVADALGKLAAQLGIPVRALWEMVPGVTDQTLRRWEDMADERDLMSQLNSMFPSEDDTAQEEPVAVGSSNGANPTASP